jgi:hypothetical protein
MMVVRTLFLDFAVVKSDSQRCPEISSLLLGHMTLGSPAHSSCFRPLLIQGRFKGLENVLLTQVTQLKAMNLRVWCIPVMAALGG